MTYVTASKILNFFLNKGVIFYEYKTDDFEGLVLISDVEDDAHQGIIATIEEHQTYIQLKNCNICDFRFYREVQL